MTYAMKEAEAAKKLLESIRATDGDDDVLAIDMVEGETKLFDIIDSILARMIFTKGLVAGADQAERDMGARKRRFEDRFKADRALIEQALMVAEITTKIERPLATFRLTPRAQSLEITEESAIPSDFWKAQDPVLDKKAITEALKAGDAIPGAVLTNAAPTLTVRFS